MMLLISGIYVFVGLIVLYFSYLSSKENNSLGRKLAVVLFLASTVTILYGFHLILDFFVVQSFIYSIIFSNITLLLIFLLSFIFEYTDFKLPKAVSIFLYCFYAVETILLLCNPFCNIFARYEHVHIYDGSLLKLEFSNMLIFHFGLAYLIMVSILVVLIIKTYKVPQIYRVKYLMIFFCLLAVSCVNAFFVYTATELDISIILYGVIASFIFISTFKYKPRTLIYSTYKLIFSNMTDPIVLFDMNNEILQHNPALKKTFHLTDEEIKKLTLLGFTKRINLNIRRANSETKIERKIIINNIPKYYLIDYIPLHDKRELLTGTLIVFQDITELKSINDELEKIATTDQLTGLYNKFIFDYNVENVWNDNESLPTSFAIVNINNLKFINNCFGTTSGDEVIQHLSFLIKKYIRKTDFAARLYSEDFVIVMPNTKEKDAVKLINNIHKKFCNENKLTFDINFEYGVSTRTTLEQSISDHVSLAREIMSNKKMLNANSLKSSLLDSLKKSLIDNDFETEEHVERVNKLCIELGEKMQLSEKDMTKLSLLALLHDIGKIAIPDYILLKPGKLTNEEWEIMKQHTTKGYRIANSYPELAEISELILSHHERWDGNGYPRNLKGDEIPLLAQIITVLDSYDVMTNNRPYHKAMPQEDAIAELKRCSGTQFSPKVVDEFIELLNSKNEK